MKPHKMICIAFGIFMAILPIKIEAFNPNTDCLKTLTKKNASQLQTVFNAYTDTIKYSKKLLDDGTYTLCFDPNEQREVTESFTISASPSSPLLIYGLNLSSTQTTGSLLTLSGSNITLLNSTFTASGIAIQVAKDASVTLAKNTFTVTDFINAVVFDPSVTSPIDSAIIGKKVSEADATKAESVVGKLNLDSCAGSVEMYYRPDKKKSLSYSSATCTVSTLSDKDVLLKFADATEQAIATGSCIFTCDNFNEDLSTKATFVYTNDNNQSYPFTPMPIMQFSDMPVWKFSPTGGVVYVPPSGADGGAIIVEDTGGQIDTGGSQGGSSSGTTITVTDYTAGGQTNTEGDPSGTGSNTGGTQTGDAQTGGGNNLFVEEGTNSGGGGSDNTDSQSKAQTTDTVSQGSGSCGANLSAGAPNAGGMIAQIMLLCGSIPILIGRRRR